MEAIVLAGGLGTRLRSVITDLPKPMAPVAGRPFLDYVLYSLKRQNVTRVVLAVGYKWETIRDYYSNPQASFGLEIDYSVETEPLGTGGAILKASEKITGDDFFVTNGDTYFNISLEKLRTFAIESSAEITLALKKVKDTDRYGSVEHTVSGNIVSFKEKGEVTGNGSAEINGGVYFMKKNVIERFGFPPRFSFETDFLQDKLNQLQAFGKAFNATFIDIGIPSDYNKAQKMLKDVIK